CQQHSNWPHLTF
nr:immunoglobulin light chain junction region [Macaca mulatta]MPN98954.1 immunoglobulin light chain junction region [Macaca mulatta]MPO00043.1 immunoglobulin light chain junction region [Macaca mulatta]